MLYGWCRHSGTCPKRRMVREIEAGGFGDLAEHRLLRRDDQFGESSRPRGAQSERLPTGNKQDLIRIPDNLVVSDVPDEDAAVGKGQLKFRREVFNPETTARCRSPDILDQSARR